MRYKMTTKQTAAERKAAERERKKAAGLVLCPETWLLPSQRPRFIAYVAKLAKEAELLS